MIRRLLPIVLAVLALGLVAAGCGDDDDDEGDATTTAAETTTSDTTTDATTTNGAPVDDATITQAIDQCKQSVNAAPGLQPETVADLEDLCERAASGDVEDVQEAAREVCTAVAEDTIPEGPARDQAIDTCESAAVSP